jgi:hypothetical protein
MSVTPTTAGKQQRKGLVLLRLRHVWTYVRSLEAQFVGMAFWHVVWRCTCCAMQPDAWRLLCKPAHILRGEQLSVEPTCGVFAVALRYLCPRLDLIKLIFISPVCGLALRAWSFRRMVAAVLSWSASTVLLGLADGPGEHPRVHRGMVAE